MYYILMIRLTSTMDSLIVSGWSLFGERLSLPGEMGAPCEQTYEVEKVLEKGMLHICKGWAQRSFSKTCFKRKSSFSLHVDNNSLATLYLLDWFGSALENASPWYF